MKRKVDEDTAFARQEYEHALRTGKLDEEIEQVLPKDPTRSYFTWVSSNSFLFVLRRDNSSTGGRSFTVCSYDKLPEQLFA